MGQKRARIELILVCMLFGTIGTVRRFIDLPSGALCFSRAVLAVITILVWLAITRQKPDVEAIKKNMPALALLGLMMAINWVCQFEAFRYTTIAISTVCYYTQPLFFILGAALVFKEKISKRKFICIVIAFCGMILVSGAAGSGLHGEDMKGVVFAVAGAVFYAAIVLVNKGLKDISSYDTTMMQLALAAVFVLPYVILTEDVNIGSLGGSGICWLLLMGVLHTGIAYVIYFRAVKILEAQTVAIISYIDPVEAVLLSAFFLKEPITASIIIGAAMILGATAFSELKDTKN